MTRPYLLRAVFDPAMTTNGIPEWWLALLWPHQL